LWTRAPARLTTLAPMMSLVAVAAAQPPDCAGGICNESFDGDAFVESTCEVLAARVSIDGLVDHDTGRCGQWAAGGECDQNPDFMHEQCQLSCLRRLCLAAEYAMPAEYGLPPINEETAALALAAAIHATLGSSWLELQTARPMRGRVVNERCIAQAGANFNDEALSLLAQTWQTGIPGDNGCALTSESAAIDVRPRLPAVAPHPTSSGLTGWCRVHRWSMTNRTWPPSRRAAGYCKRLEM
jgi:hypothetical protein